jgi:hypothetical protein
MKERNWGRALWGALIGLVVGAFIGEQRAAELAAEHSEIVPTGLNPLAYVQYPRFWVAVVFCTLTFGFIAGRLGRATSDSDL